MKQPVTDLFGEVPITVADLRAWLVAVVKMDPDSARARHYLRAWAVPDKVRAAKLAGTFDALTAPRPLRIGDFWDRFTWG